jgi:hypothetical protein
MQYISHDISNNLLQARQFNDLNLNRDIIHDEISKLIVNDRNNVRKAVVDAGIEFKSQPTKEYVAKLVAQNINNNAKLRRNIASLIQQNNNVPAELNFEGDDKDKKGANKLKPHSVKSEGFIYDSVYFAFAGDGESIAQNETSLLNKIKTHSINFDALTGAEKKKLIKTIVYTTLITSAVLVAGYFTLRYFVRKRKAEREAMEGSMGNMDNNNIQGQGMQPDMNNGMNQPNQMGQSQPFANNPNINVTPNGIYDNSFQQNNG